VATRKRLQVRERWKDFITTAAGTFADAEGELSRNRISAIDGDYKALFAQIMGVSDVVPDLRRDAAKQDVHVQLSDFHGLGDLSARALLSESYRNALAISIFLAAAMKQSGSPRFVVLDDVTSSFDSGHQWNLMEAIRTKLQQPRNGDGNPMIKKLWTVAEIHSSPTDKPDRVFIGLPAPAALRCWQA
jgi:hypothetical protein